MKLWDKGTSVNELIEKFTVGKDREMDLYLAKFDVLGSIAHAKMLQSINLLSESELAELQSELVKIYQIIENGDFSIEDGVEDVHSQVELMLTRKLGDTGKKIHSGRSRNDQVLLDLKLFTRSEIEKLVEAVGGLFDKLMGKAEANKNYLMPGYTHLQVAMPSSFGLWFSAYAESLVDDLVLLQAAYRITNQNPLGSAAGYGSSFPLDRQMTTDLLGFDSMNYNVIYAQMGRGKIEKTVAFALSSIAATISKLAFDVCLFMSQNFGFVSLPDELTTGSSIMPHKKNPDVFELVRSHCNKIQAIPYQISLITNNLPSGYFRDLQILKEVFLPAFQELQDCIDIAGFAVDNMSVNTNLLADDRYKYVFSVEDVNKLVMQGVPFRDAYKQVGNQINSGTYEPTREVNHTHAGSVGNLCLDEISGRMKKVVEDYEFKTIEKAYRNLLGEF
jgi:argininosuccinate lyase